MEKQIMAVKSYSAYVLFMMGLLLSLISIGLIVIGISYIDINVFWLVVLALFLLCILGIIICVQNFKDIRAPRNLIIKNGNYLILCIPDEIKLNINNIEDTKYQRYNSRRINYSSGIITILMNNGVEYKVQNIANVEKVGIQLSKLIYGWQKRN